jgi:molybdopterin synthase catalytic subunit
VQTADFDVGAEFTALTAGHTDIGGIGCFVGTVRANPDGPPLVALTLEHYPGMTERAIAGIVADAGRRWPLLGCTVVHRVGRLLPGENIVLVLAASAHRQAALDATAFLIDWLKTQAPFWKQEIFEDGSRIWVEAREVDDAAAARWGQGSSPSPSPEGEGWCQGRSEASSVATNPSPARSP